MRAQDILTAIALIGNRLRHEYDRLSVTVIWKTAADSSDLEVLQHAIREAFPGVG